MQDVDGYDYIQEADTLIVNPYSGGSSYIASFNGDDVRALVHNSGTNTLHY